MLFGRCGEGREDEKKTLKIYSKNIKTPLGKVAHSITFGAFGLPSASLLMPLGVPFGAFGGPLGVLGAPWGVDTKKDAGNPKLKCAFWARWGGWQRPLGNL